VEQVQSKILINNIFIYYNYIAMDTVVVRENLVLNLSLN